MSDATQSPPNVAEQQARRIANVGCFGVPVVLVGTTLAIRHFLGWSFGKAATMAICAYWCPLYAVFVVAWLRNKSRAGRVLLDCGERPYRLIFLLYAAVSGFIAVVTFVAIAVAASHGKKDLQTYILVALFFATSATYFLIMASGRLQIRENGILAYVGLLT